MSESYISAPPTPFKDRSTGLVVFGILTLLLGGVCALLVPLMLVGQAMTAQATGAPANNMSLLPAIFMYGALAVALIWLGIGSMKSRRWARALLLIFSWSWLVMGVVALVMMVILMPRILAVQPSAGQPPMPEEAKLMVTIISLAMIGFIFVVLPAIWVFFYRSPHVKATCEARDPVPRWTDACPLPVLAVSLWLGFSALMMVTMPLAQGGVLPFFGQFLTGAAGVAAYFVLAAIWAWCAWALYRLDVRGWWVAVAVFCVMAASHVITYSQRDVMEMYALMGYPEQQLEEIRRFSAITGEWMTWGMLVFLVPFAGYMIYVKRFFGKGRADTAAG
jgi:hypothetical protein